MEVMLHARHLKDERLQEIVVECGTRNVLSTFFGLGNCEAVAACCSFPFCLSPFLCVCVCAFAIMICSEWIAMKIWRQGTSRYVRVLRPCWSPNFLAVA